MSIGKRIQDIRKKHGITQEQLAEALGVSRQSISKWESNQSSPDAFNIVKMSDLYEITTDYILKGIELDTPVSQTTQQSETIPFYKENPFKTVLSALIILGGVTIFLIIFIIAMSALN